MPNIKSAAKRDALSKAQNAANKARKSEMKTLIKKLDAKVAEVPFVFLLVLAFGFVAMLVADADAAKREFAVLRAVGATRGQLTARLAHGALRTAAWGIVFGLPVGALVGWLFAIKTGSVWPGLPHYFVVPWQVLAEGTLGALAFVLVVAVPTSVGYGASFKGVAPLLTMLNSCAEGMSVVNIDNGFGAGYLAARINTLIETGHPS